MTETTSAPATFRLWGAVEARKNSEPVRMGSPRELCMLAGLIEANGKDIQRETLKKWIWDDEPASASGELDHFMAHLRKRLDGLGLDGALINGNGLCRLAVPPESVDVHRAKALKDAPKRDDQHAAELLGQALRLTDGEPLAGLRGRQIEHYRRELEGNRLALQIEYYQVEARLGRCREHLGELSHLFAEHQGDAAVTALTMYALYFAGRRPDALEIYRNHAKYMRNEEGLDVSQKISDLHGQVLNNALTEDSFAIDKPYQSKGEPPMHTTNSIVLAIRPDTGDLEEVRQAVAESFAEGQVRTRMADGCLICVVSPDVGPVQVARTWMDRLVGAVRQRAQVGIAIGDESHVRELVDSEYARRVLNGAPRGSNLVITVSDDLYELITRSPGGELDATGYRRAENGVGGWVRVPGLSTPPHPRADKPRPDPGSDTPIPGGPNVTFYGPAKIGEQNVFQNWW